MAKRHMKSASSTDKKQQKAAAAAASSKSGKDGSRKRHHEEGDRKVADPKDETNKSETMTLCALPSTSATQIRQRRPGRLANGKRVPATKEMPGKLRSSYRRSLDPCDNSNDSGLGFDHHMDPHQMSLSERLTWTGERAQAKRPRMDIKLEHDECNDGYSFPDTIRSHKDPISLIRTAPAGSVPSLSITNNMASTSGRAVARCVPLTSRQSASTPVSLTTQLSSSSRFNDVTLAILKQPEQQHRARYQTEGSRGAVKDREGNGFPIVQLHGYYKPATLQVFIGTDVGKVAPHMFYQACKVSGKNSTPCVEKKVDGTCVIELQLDPSKDMSATCDCVGILKERNVDVEHRFPDQLGNRSKKKSTRCRMIFRTTLVMDDGTQETLQVCSQPIVCTQPPGVPEICKKSLKSCPANGGEELFVLGKNFLKDTKVFFQQYDGGQVVWESGVTPDKEYLQQTHFVCVIPAYRRLDITEPVQVRLSVMSSGKTSETHQFVYTPLNGAVSSVHVDAVQAGAGGAAAAAPQAPFLARGVWHSLSKREQDLDMMPPPESSLVPLATTRRPSISMPSSNEVHSPPLHALKQEYIDESSNSSMMNSMDARHERFRYNSEGSLDVHHGDSNMSMITDVMSHTMNDNSNLSIGEDSVDTMVRRNSMSSRNRSICENSMDVTTNMSMNEDSSCSTVMPCSSSVHTDRLVLSQSNLQNEKVMDLRMKMPMADLSMHRFGMLDATPTALPSQTAQSVENYLNRIENPKNLLVSSSPFCTQKILPPQTQSMTVLPRNTNNTEPVFLTSDRPFLASSTQSDAVTTLVAKSEAAAVAENTMIEQTTTIAATTLTNCLDSTVPTAINTEKLDALVNSTVESHIGSPTRSNAANNKMPTITTTAPRVTEVMMTSQDMILNNTASLMVPVPNMMTSPVQDMTQNNSIPPDVILNSQISPSLMCHTNADSLLPVTQQSMSTQESMGALHSPIAVTAAVSNTLGLATEPEKAVLLEAAVDFLQTQNKICQMNTTLTTTSTAPTTTALSNDTMSQLTQGTSFVQTPYATTNAAIMPKTIAQDCLPIPVKEITNSVSNDKKNEDRMIPQGFTSLTENELINLINPSCFDQV
ncbi:uncharacterized protein LOC109594196 isoform X2 [Aethina tumida]|uniref:uncharacterized protein LOC109594196 isoform X2 n=1 Tax=Aethina tumida TaxID=116153 RepID=UPI002147F789|nr:uncharacterized protein LOC109594196 isoform X2 [Aethina tumida]